MKQCHVCGFECEDNAVNCMACGAELETFQEYMERIEKLLAIEKATVNEPVLVASIDNVVTAEIYKDVLRDNEIPFTCNDKETVQVVFGGGFVAAEIYVKEESFDKAKELYEEVLKANENFFEDDDLQD